ncbi:MAG: type IX secretion system protein PorQ [Bacteroidota bacterium]
MKRNILILAFAIGFHASIYAQIGGRHVYDFLNLAPSARLNSLGGVNVSLMDDDVHMAAVNPALANDSMHKHVALSWTNYLVDIGYGYTGYSHTIEGVGSLHGGIQFISYGELQGADEFGNLTGTFNANELAAIVGMSREIGPFRYGANLKFIQSNLGGGFTSNGLALDLGGAYTSKSGLFQAGLAFQNIGFQLTPYVEGGNTEPLPFEIVMGISQKLKYMPLRFSVTLVHLETPRLVFDDPDAPMERDLNGNVIESEAGFADKLFRHVVFGGEFLLGKALRLRFGYNHMRRQELRAENRGGFTGFSLGAGVKIKRFSLDYGYASYGINNAFQAHQFSMLLNLQKSK